MHDVVRSHTRMILLQCLVSYSSARLEESNKTCYYFKFTSLIISNFTQVCELIFLSLGCSLVLWFNLNKSSWTFCCVSHTKLWGVETNMAVTSAMTCKISFIWRHMKTPYICKFRLILLITSHNYSWPETANIFSSIFSMCYHQLPPFIPIYVRVWSSNEHGFCKTSPIATFLHLYDFINLLVCSFTFLKVDTYWFWTKQISEKPQSFHQDVHISIS